MAGMCRQTGRRLEGWDHIAQSLQVLFTTRLNTRLERRRVGSAAPELVDMPATGEAILDHYVAMADAIDQFEPRVILNGFGFDRVDANGDARILVDLTEVLTGVNHTVER